MEMLLAEVGPLVVAQLVTPLTPVTLQVPIALGAIAAVGPVTVAVKVIVEPSKAELAPATMPTVGVAFATEVVLPEVGDVAK